MTNNCIKVILFALDNNINSCLKDEILNNALYNYIIQQTIEIKFMDGR